MVFSYGLSVRSAWRAIIRRESLKLSASAPSRAILVLTRTSSCLAAVSVLKSGRLRLPFTRTPSIIHGLVLDLDGLTIRIGFLIGSLLEHEPCCSISKWQ